MANIKFLIALATMYAGFLVHFWLDEKIIDKNNEPFAFPYRQALPFFCQVTNVIAALIILITKRTKFIRNPLPYLSVSIPMYISVFGSTLAKKYINYASVNVLKSAKPVAVMIVSIVVYKRKIPLKRVFSVIGLCIGLVIFGTQPGSASSVSESRLKGYQFIALALISEGFYSPQTDKLNKMTNNPYITMMYVQMWNAIIAFIVNFKEITTSFVFIAENKDFIKQIGFLVLSGSVAQVALYTVVGLSDGLVLSIATTTRKFITILLSSIIFKHNFTPLQWIGIAIVFAALGFDIFSKKKSAPKPVEKKKEEKKKEINEKEEEEDSVDDENKEKID
jgi:UDP-galactose transporter B1